MKKKLLYFILSASICLSIFSSTVSASTNCISSSSKDFTLCKTNDNLPKKVRYKDAIFENCKLDKDIKYKTATNYAGDQEDLLLDVYSPDGDTKKNRPAIIWVHGGALAFGSKDEQEWFQTIYSKSFAKKGYVAVNINYRLNPNADNDWNGSMKNAMEDVVSAIDWVKDNSKKYGIDKNNIILAGYSSGAEIVTNVAYGTYVDSWDRKGISAVVDMAGNRLFWGDAIKNGPPCTIIHGTNDDINKISDSQILVDQLTKANIKCDFNPIDGEDHYFANSTEKIDDIITKFLYGNVIKR